MHTAKQVQKYFEKLRAKHRVTLDVQVKRELVETPLTLSHKVWSRVGLPAGDVLSGRAQDPPCSTGTGPQGAQEALSASISQISLPSSGPAWEKIASSSSPSAASQNILLLSTQAAPSHQKRKPNKKIARGGYNLMDDFFTHVSKTPSRPQRLELLEKVRHLEGCEHYTLKSLTAYFYHLRTRKHRVPRSGVGANAEEPDSEFQSNKAALVKQEPYDDSLLVSPVSPDQDAPLSSPILVLSDFDGPAQSSTHIWSVAQQSPLTHQSASASMQSTLVQQPPLFPSTGLPLQSPPLVPFSYTILNSPVAQEKSPLPAPRPELRQLPPGAAEAPEPGSAAAATQATNHPSESDVAGDTSTGVLLPSPESDLSPETKTQPKSSRTYLAPEAHKLLEDYYVTVSMNPSKAEKAALASRVSAAIAAGVASAPSQVGRACEGDRAPDIPMSHNLTGAVTDAQIENSSALDVVSVSGCAIGMEHQSQQSSPASVENREFRSAIASEPGVPASEEAGSLSMEEAAGAQGNTPDISMSPDPHTSARDVQLADIDQGSGFAPAESHHQQSVLDAVRPHPHGSFQAAGKHTRELGVTVSARETIDTAPGSDVENDSAGAVLPDTDPIPEQKKPRNLPPEAHNILADYYATVGVKPSKADEVVLANQINAIPGCESFSARNVHRWFRANKYFKNGRCAVRKEDTASGGQRNAEQTLVGGVKVAVDSIACEAQDVPGGTAEAAIQDEAGQDSGKPDVPMLLNPDAAVLAVREEESVIPLFDSTYASMKDSISAGAMEPDTSPAVDYDANTILQLATQLQGVFARSPELHEDQPVTFARFAAWLETRNIGLCT
ncbi:hypothetical protein BD309DRAFT_994554 [Dichomitus squalens]|uniref:Uncharacterized protein n=1 Tax=Dichomitus squalens TaxID=114155 RepID=A0A4Q9NCU5_9APHY|nr:hypothetical protein BD309DRAFT_994554 [Dichomitus squalens]TBU51428.1 hypothetical protein BD310DRAFT_953279 [Dichomitus squalens]